MYRIILALLVSVSAQHFLSAQPSWHAADSASYAAYQAGEWHKVLEITDHSLSNGVDFYYLRVRAGKAAYELRKYRLAVLHFSEAYRMNTSDDFVNYWYYFALLESGRRDEALITAARFDRAFTESMHIRKVGRVTGLMAETSYSVNHDFGSLSMADLSSATSYIGYRNTLRHQFYKGIGIDHRLGSRVYVFHGLSHLGISRQQTFGSPYPLPAVSAESRSSQMQYYLQGRYYTKGGWMVTSSLTLLGGTADSDYYTFTQTGQAVLNSFTYKIGDYVQALSLARETHLARFAVSLSAGNINDYRQLQAEGHISVYPFANPDFYLVSGLAAHNDASYEQMKYVFSQQAGFKAGPVWITGSGTIGTIRNFSSLHGYVIYNMPEEINGIYSMSLYVPLSGYRLGITLRYQMTGKEGITLDYTSPTEYRVTNYNFLESNFLITLKWNL